MKKILFALFHLIKEFTEDGKHIDELGVYLTNTKHPIIIFPAYKMIFREQQFEETEDTLKRSDCLFGTLEDLEEKFEQIETVRLTSEDLDITVNFKEWLKKLNAKRK